MLIFIDNRSPNPAKEKLSDYGEVIPFSTNGITYESISGHPDIFMCRVNKNLIVAPNLPENFKKILKNNSVSFVEGELPVEKKYPGTSRYNIVATENYLIHNFRYTDSVITDVGEDLDLIHSGQGYTRCNLLPLKEDRFITSDEGIKRVLERFSLKCFYVNPSEILLQGERHGFFGGVCGIHENTIFVNGNLSRINQGEELKNFLKGLKYDIVELYDGPLFDGGSILFI